MRQCVKVTVHSFGHWKALSYVWKGDAPLVIGDIVRVRNPNEQERYLTPLVEGVVTDLNSDYQGYLVVINSKVPQ